MAVSAPRMSRDQRAQINDATIRESLVHEIATQGWDSVTISKIAKQSGLSVGAIYSRAETLAELANELWNFQLRSFFSDFLKQLEVGLVSQDPSQLIDLSASMEKQQDMFSVVLELAVSSQFDDELEEVVGQDFEKLIQGAIQGNPKHTPVQSAGFTLSLGFLLGQAFARKHHAVGRLSPHDAALLCSYWASSETNLDTTEQIGLKPFRNLQTENNENSLSILKVIAKRGYKKATVSRMARAQGMTAGAIFGGYKSKADLVGQSAEKVLLTPIEVWQQYSSLMDNGASPLARALFLREYMNPRHEDYWRIALELARVGETSPELAPFRTPADALQRTHLAMALIAAYAPQAWKLPFYGPFLNGTAT